MKIRFWITGGIAGLSRHCEVDTESLADGERERITKLVEKIDIHGVEKKGTMPDREGVRIEIELDDTIRTIEVSLSDTMEEALRSLIAFLTQRAKFTKL